MSLLIDGAEVVVFPKVFPALQRDRTPHKGKRPGGNIRDVFFLCFGLARDVSAKRRQTAARGSRTGTSDRRS